MSSCNLTNDQKIIDVTGYTGGSVLLPCSCDDPQSTVNTFTWEIWHNGSQWMNAFKKHRGRFKLFNEISPGNLSLLISDFREEDEGIYRCITEQRSFTDVFLKVTGCDLDQQTQTVEVTGYLGESVVLPCFCTESLTKPDKIIWKFIEKNYEEIYPSEHNERYKNRRKLINQTNPGNLSLHLSSLTKEDQGDYLCSVYNSYIYIRLHIEEKPEVYTIYSSTHQPSQHELITTQQPENKITHQTHNTTVCKSKACLLYNPCVEKIC
nr:uncharacterized protein LOC129429193 [Misgurnus anguillicaudatus]